ncbi:MAG: EAL domain-containing protein [Gammaproteobacteria bacterium]|nr:EAL domain-containing protein [Gammaproteobacteria bacterium]
MKKSLTIIKPWNKNKSIISALKIALIYCLFATLWIILSDKILEAIVTSKEILSLMQTIKGLLFVVITMLLVFFLVLDSNKSFSRIVIELQESELRFRQLAENIDEVFWLGSPDWQEVFYVSPAYEQKWGQSANTLYDNPQLWMQAIHPDDLELVLADIPKNLDSITDFIEFREYRIYGKAGELLWIKAKAFPIRDSDGKIIRIAGIAEDITERKKSEEKFLYQAHYDTLTHLPNRFLALDRLTQLINEAKRENKLVAVLFIDLDDFKKINDTLGHEAGDQLLVEAAVRLSNEIRAGDTVCRLGGDEFFVLLGGLENIIDVKPFAENLLKQFNDSFLIDNRQLMLSISIGIAIFPNDGDSASELLRNSDSAMYHSKDLGRNTISYFTDSMNKDASRRLSIEEQLHGALDRDEFEVYFQPKINIQTNKIMGAEALLRWHNPALGSVSPVEFIPIAEQTGMIAPLGQFVLNEALAITAQWQQDFNSNFSMAVNLSPRQFRDLQLVSKIEEIIKSNSINCKNIELEITEGVLMSGFSHVDETLASLNKLGVNIAMDDFGTGYSSLSYLRKYPFNILKIDRSFINDITNDSEDWALINAAIVMAHGMKLKVVAEGVETEEQLACLKTMGCDYGQGYLFGKPMPGKEMTQLLQSKK